MSVNTILQHTLSILLHGHLIDLKQEHGFQWSVVAVKELRFFVSNRAFTRVGIVM